MEGRRIPRILQGILETKGYINYCLSCLQGNGTNVLRIIPYMAVQFAAYEEYKKVLRPCIALLIN